jgi:hypothetical protein
MEGGLGIVQKKCFQKYKGTCNLKMDSFPPTLYCDSEGGGRGENYIIFEKKLPKKN